MLLNSCSMFKKTTALFLVFVFILSLAGCKKDIKKYRIVTEVFYSDSTKVCIKNYSYSDGNLLGYEVLYPTLSSADYSVSYAYNVNGDKTALQRIEATGEISFYNAEKITDTKYIFHKSMEDGTLTELYDNTGYLISSSSDMGYYEAFLYSYNKKGDIDELSRQVIHPSGSNKTYHYSVNKQSDTFYILNGEEEGNYIEVTLQEVK